MISRELAGDFVNYLYDYGFILGNRVSAKTFVQRKFRNFLQETNRTLGAYDNDSTLDQLLRDYEFINKNVRDEKIYKFDMRAIFNYRNDVIAQMDAREIDNAKNAILSTEDLNKANSIQEKPKLLDDFPAYELIFQFKIKQNIDESFILSSKGCYCCQTNFLSEEEFTAHIEHHSQETDFEYRSRNRNETLPQQFSVTYKLCEKAHLLFSVKSVNSRHDIIVERIIVFRSGTVHYLEDALVPYFLPDDGSSFYVNCHIFQIAYEQPLLVVFKSKSDPKGVRYVEEHHFLRFDVFPINVSLKTKHVFRRGELQATEKLKEYLPSALAKQLHCNEFDDKVHPVKRNIRDYFKKLTPLGHENICDVFDLLIEMDDFAISTAYEKFKRRGVKVEGCASDYSVKIIGLADEKQDNVLTNGDRIILLTKMMRAKKGNNTGNPLAAGTNDVSDVKFFGMITNIVGERVYFETKTGKIPIDLMYEVTFEPQRLSYMFQHVALEKLRNDLFLRARLFPEDSVRNSSALICLDYYNPALEMVPEQKDAVRNIVENQNKLVPFIIFGPPGTGKTTVVVEAILQLRKQSYCNRILVMAGSNAACDEIAARLAKTFNTIDPDGLNFLRIYACSSEKRIDNMNEDVLEASNLCYGQHFYPSLETIYTYPIVIVTLCVAGKLVHGKITSNHFTHVFIDECGASTEPESIVGLAGIISSSAHLILSGDPKQLGPIIECRRAADYGLEISLLERLMDRKCYEPHPLTREYNRSIQARLTRNFRSHKDILALPSQLFYENELKVMASPEITDFAIGWSGLRTKSFPIVFESVRGVMRKLKNSTSSCNYEELTCVLLCLKELMYFGIRGRKIRQEDIGVISPYKMQCQLIRRVLDQRGWFRIETGSVETFQGQEKPIIIASMVRSKVDTPGFLDNPKRLNVLLTRAQALLILIGNPDTLIKIGHWKYVVEYCIENKALRGVELKTSDHDSDESDATVRSMQNLCLKDNRKFKNRLKSQKKDHSKYTARHFNENNTKMTNADKGNHSNNNRGDRNKNYAKKRVQDKLNKMENSDQKKVDWEKWLEELPDVINLFASNNSTDDLSEKQAEGAERNSANAKNKNLKQTKPDKADGAFEPHKKFNREYKPKGNLTEKNKPGREGSFQPTKSNSLAGASSSNDRKMYNAQNQGSVHQEEHNHNIHSHSQNAPIPSTSDPCKNVENLSNQQLRGINLYRSANLQHNIQRNPAPPPQIGSARPQHMNSMMPPSDRPMHLPPKEIVRPITSNTFDDGIRVYAVNPNHFGYVGNIENPNPRMPPHQPFNSPRNTVPLRAPTPLRPPMPLRPPTPLRAPTPLSASGPNSEQNSFSTPPFVRDGARSGQQFSYNTSFSEGSSQKSKPKDDKCTIS